MADIYKMDSDYLSAESVYDRTRGKTQSEINASSILKLEKGNLTSPSTAPGNGFVVNIPLPSDANEIKMINAWAMPTQSYTSVAVTNYVLTDGTARFVVIGSTTQTFLINYQILYI